MSFRLASFNLAKPEKKHKKSQKKFSPQLSRPQERNREVAVKPRKFYTCDLQIRANVLRLPFIALAKTVVNPSVSQDALLRD